VHEGTPLTVKGTQEIPQSESISLNEQTPKPSPAREEPKPRANDESKRAINMDRTVDRPPVVPTVRAGEPPRRVDVSAPTSVESTPASTPLNHQRAAAPPREKEVVVIAEDPLAKKRRMVREEAHRAYLKSSLVRANAMAKFDAAEANVLMAEIWLKFVDKALEDVGRRIELQDWKFKKIDEGMDLQELLEVPILDDGVSDQNVDQSSRP
jgi:hypothetical protein